MNFNEYSDAMDLIVDKNPVDYCGYRLIASEHKDYEWNYAVGGTAPATHDDVLNSDDQFQRLADAIEYMYAKCREDR